MIHSPLPHPAAADAADAAPSWVLNLTCPDHTGIVAAVAGFLTGQDANITETSQFNDTEENTFFMRAAFSPAGAAFPSRSAFEAMFTVIAERFDMRWRLTDASQRAKVLIAVSRFGHCLFDLLHRWRTGLLPVEIVGVLSNHDDMRSFVEWNGLPYFHLPVTKQTKTEQEGRFLAIVEEHEVDLVVLARYMQVVSPVEQGVERVDHSRSSQALVDIGRDIECAVLARAVRWHVENRIMLNGVRTVVFS